MTQTPITVTYSLEEALSRIEKRIDERFDEVNQKLDDFKKDIDSLRKDVNDLKVGQARLEAELKGDIKSLETEVKGIGKRLDNQEFISRGVLLALIVAILGGLAKLFGLVGNP